MADGSNGKPKTELLDQLEKGPWPSFVKEIKQACETSDAPKDLLGQLELSYQEKKGHWKHGGLVGVLGYGGGVIGRYSDLPEQFPKVAHFHTIRVNQPAGWFYTSDALRTICDIWEKHRSGLTNMHGSTGDMVLLGTTTDQLEPTFQELANAGFDLGGSGSDLRTPSCCVGQARCEWACYDTMKLCYNLTMNYQDELHRPAFAYKFKIKMAGCPNDCVASIARADCSVIGTWKDDIQVDEGEVANYAAADDHERQNQARLVQGGRAARAQTRRRGRTRARHRDRTRPLRSRGRRGSQALHVVRHVHGLRDLLDVLQQQLFCEAAERRTLQSQTGVVQRLQEVRRRVPLRLYRNELTER
jgi:dissimilatory sulfite reductase alpha subunit